MIRICTFLIVAAALTLGGCGVKGPLEPPSNPPPSHGDPFVLDPLI